LVISEAVFTANHLTDTDKQNNTGKYKQTQNKSLYHHHHHHHQFNTHKYSIKKNTHTITDMK